MTTDVITDGTTITDAFEEAAAEKLAEEAESAEETTSEATDSGLNAQGGILPSLGEQTELEGAGFEKPEKSTRQIAEDLLEACQADVDKKQKAVGTARTNLRVSETLRDEAEELLRRTIRAENEAAGVKAEAEAAEEEYAPTCTGAPCPVYADGDGELAGKKVCHDGDDVSAVMVAEIGVTECPRHVGETGAGDSGIIPDQPVDPITGQPVKGEPTDKGAVVVAVYPGDDPVATTVGPSTQYAELIADYLAHVGSDDDPENWRVVAERELSDPDAEYGRREPHDVIWAGDYGSRLRVVAADQGSVTAGDAA